MNRAQKRALNRTLRPVLLAAACCGAMLLTAVPAEAQYRYGGYSGSGGEGGFFIFVEGGIGTPRNVDPVVATQRTFGTVQSALRIRPGWDDDPAGRIGIGYAFGNGNKLTFSGWSHTTEQRISGDGVAGGQLDYAIGPPIDSGGQIFGASGSPGHYDILTEVSGTLGDIQFAREQELGEAFDLEFGIGLRYALYEETSTGFYDDAAAGGGAFGVNRYDAAKRLESTMIGLRANVKGTWHLTRHLSAAGGFGFSQLEGEIDGSSTLTPSGTGNPGLPIGTASFFDDGRSGRIVDFEALLIWRTEGGKFRVWGGWEQSTWDDLPKDLLRNYAGTASPLPSRDAVGFSAVKLGAGYRF